MHLALWGWELVRDAASDTVKRVADREIGYLEILKSDDAKADAKARLAEKYRLDY